MPLHLCIKFLIAHFSINCTKMTTDALHVTFNQQSLTGICSKSVVHAGLRLDADIALGFASCFIASRPQPIFHTAH